MNKKKNVILISAVSVILVIALFLCIVYHQVQKKKEAEAVLKQSSRKELKVIDFHNFPEGSDNKPQQVQKQNLKPRQQPVKTVSLNQKASDLLFEMEYMLNPRYKKSTVNSSRQESVSLGNNIPDWVYKNTASTDRYSDIIRANSNVIFAIYTTPQKEQSGKAMIRRSINRYDVNNFKDKSARLDKKASVHETCKKASIDLMCDIKITNPRNEDSSYRCKCAYDYLLENCTNKFCLINPKQKRIVIISFDEYTLAKKLNDLKNNW